MSKNYQKAARGCLYALAVVIAGVCFSVKPAQSATCFLPSGNCSTGKIGGGPAPEATPEYCTGYNISQYEYNKKYNNTSCFSCTYCTKTVGNKETVFKCDNVEGSNWSDGYHTCCTDNTSFDIDEGACCPAGGCKHDCPTGKSWSKGLKQCVCPSDVETDSNGNCCASGQVLENGSCTTPCEMNACDDYTYTTDPGNSEKCDLGCNKGYRYKCKSGYTYSNGKCVEKCAIEGYTLTGSKNSNCYSCSTCPTDSSKYKCTESVKSGYQLVNGVCESKPTPAPEQCAASGYTLTSKLSENCYSCTACPADSSKYKCTESVKSGYQLVNGVCSVKQTEKPTITITLELDGTSSSGSEASTVKFTNTASDGKSYTVKLIIDGDGDNGINYPLTVTQGSKVTYSSRYYETSDCDVYGDCRGDDNDNGREFSSDPTATSVMVNGKTVLSNIATIDKLAGKSFSTSDYIINFVDSRYIDISYTYVKQGNSSNTWCFKIMSSSPVKKDITVLYEGSYSCYEVDNTLTGEEHTWGHQFQGSATIKKGSKSATGDKCWQNGSENNMTRGCNLDEMNIHTPSWDGVKDSDGYTYYWDYQEK